MDNLVFPPNFKDKNVVAFFTTKASGRVNPKYFVPKTSGSTIYLPIQKHTDKVLVLDDDLEPKIGDAVVTNRKDIFIGVQTADCVPVLLFDSNKNVIAAIHAGWRGTAAGILKKTINLMYQRYLSEPDGIFMAVGPSIRWRCYDVGYDVIEAVKKETGKGDYFLKIGEKYFIDLATANMYQALALGIKKENIWISEECTYCLPEKYFSYRFSKGLSGRQYGLIGLMR
jgi:YfiH family protein